ncbi:MAG: glycosyltransferase, partial [Chitinophagaceae bacterium]
ELYKISPRKTVVIHPAASSFFKPVLQEQREKIKEKYCEGKEYFFCKVIDDQVVLINLLKAFSQFKKMQKSGMKFLFATNFSGKASSFMQSFATYKYREDVILLNNLSEEETALITASAYAAVIPFSNEETMITVLEALQSGVPAIVSENAAVKEITGEASLYSDITNPKDTGEKLMRIYIDENLRTQLAERGKQVAPSYSSQKTAELLLQAILQVVK